MIIPILSENITRFPHRAILILLLAWTVMFSSWVAWRTSMTVDEGIHVASAYLAIERGDFRFDPEHPYLFKYLTAAPLFLIKPNLPPNDVELWDAAAPTALDSWKEARLWSEAWFFDSGNNPQTMLILARIPAIILLTLFTLLTYLFVSREWGKNAGLWAAFFTSFSPTFIAHGVLTNTDMPLAFCYVLHTFTLLKYHKQPGPKQALLVALTLAAAMLTKHSGVILIPITVLWLGYTWYVQKVNWRIFGAHILMMIFTVWALIWVGYGFHSEIRPDDTVLPEATQELYAQLAKTGMDPIQLLRTASHILPIDYIKGLALTIGFSTLGKQAYLLQTIHPIGFWYYFPVLFLLKTQLIALILGIVGAVSYIRAKRILVSPAAKLLFLILLVLGVVSITSKINLGIRHISPLLWIFYCAIGVYTATLFSSLSRQRSLTIFLGVVICGGYAVPVIMQRNNLIGFSNEFVYPKENAYRYFNDSNLDWNGGLHDVAQAILEEAAEHGDEVVYINSDEFTREVRHIEYYMNQSGASRIPRLQSFNTPPDQGLIVLQAQQLSMIEARRAAPYNEVLATKPTRIIPGTAFFYRLP